MKMEIKPEEIVKVHQSPIDLYNQSFRSEQTRYQYNTKLKKVLCEFLNLVLKGNPTLIEQQMKQPQVKHRGIKRSFYDADYVDRANEFVTRAKQDPDWAEATLLKLAEKLKERSDLPYNDNNFLDPKSINGYFLPVWRLFDMNNVPLSWKRIRNILPPENENKDDTTEYTHQDIQIMLDHSAVPDKVLVFLYASSGIRAGASEFKWKHVRPVYVHEGRYRIDEHEITESISKNGTLACGMIRVYAGSKWQYFALTTPECWKAIQAYRQEWIRETGKEPQPEDPFFKQYGPVVKPLTSMGVRKRLERLLLKSGIRTPLSEGSRRHKIPTFNGFRRFFNKQNKKSLSKNSALASLILKETMMGHTGLIKLDESYFKEHIEEIIDEYLNAIPYLTIYDHERKSLEISSKDQRIQQLEDELKVEKFKSDKLVLQMFLEMVQTGKIPKLKESEIQVLAKRLNA